MDPSATPRPDRLRLRPTAAELNRLLATLDVRRVGLAECEVSPGWRLDLTGPAAPGLHYTLQGAGRLVLAGHAPIALRPHTLVIVPPSLDFALEVEAADRRPLRVQDSRGAPFVADGLRRHSAGDPPPALVVICGYVRAIYGARLDLFAGLSAPIVEPFAPADRLDDTLRDALDELRLAAIGDGVVAAALMMQVMVRLLRRALEVDRAWVGRLAVLADPQIARAFAAMVDDPEARHTVQSLARVAGLGRTAFMTRFARAFAASPMAALRDLRLRRAARALVAGEAGLDQVAYAAGYKDRTGFLRAFRKAYGCDPTALRAAVDRGERVFGI
jgi:AraC family transcriptional activator of mtrCDE